MTNNNESNNSGWIFLAGLATGAVLGYLINTDKGRQIRTDAATKAVEYGEQARTVAQSAWETTSETVNSIIGKGKEYASEVSTKLQERISSASSTAQNKVEEAESAFQQGANKAKARVNEIAAN
ncbi:MAG: YtxH domain-containing protein [Lewinellaceae bacterium]|nr:YtxH domain-containing protein [Saprospiraceae bacterium]MCB9340336.1 YtxH domain-containing protein [Lewinellaceae bacterium]